MVITFESCMNVLMVITFVLAIDCEIKFHRELTQREEQNQAILQYLVEQLSDDDEKEKDE